MTPRLALALLAVLVAACATAPRPFTDEFYAPIRVRSAGDVAPVAVFGFVDARENTEPTVVLHYETERDVPRVDRATRPVAEGVAHAFVRGLRARGFTVTDTTSHRYEGQGAPGRAVVTGRVTEFGARVERSGWILQSSRQRVGCSVVLEVHDGAGGRRLFQRRYSRVTEGAMMPTEPMAVLARALADVVEQAVADPDVVAAIGAATR